MARQFSALPAGVMDGIRTSPIEELLDGHPSPGPVLIKMDIEGAEIALFEQAEAWIHRVQAVLVEPHGEGTAFLIEGAFKRHGFNLDRVGEKILGTRAPWNRKR